MLTRSCRISSNSVEFDVAVSLTFSLRPCSIHLCHTQHLNFMIYHVSTIWVVPSLHQLILLSTYCSDDHGICHQPWSLRFSSSSWSYQVCWASWNSGMDTSHFLLSSLVSALPNLAVVWPNWQLKGQTWWPQFFRFHQIWETMVAPKRLPPRHRSHISRMRSDRYSQLIKQDTFTMFACFYYITNFAVQKTKSKYAMAGAASTSSSQPQYDPGTMEGYLAEPWISDTELTHAGGPLLYWEAVLPTRPCPARMALNFLSAPGEWIPSELYYYSILN